MTVRYEHEVTEAIKTFDPNRENSYFVFGSAVRSEKFHDIDLGVVGNAKTKKSLSELRDALYDTPIPYKVDVVDFDEADEEFRSYVLEHEPKVWIR